MTEKALERYLHQHIPLSHAMDVSVVTVNSDSIVLHAPIAPNINHTGTVFGGSAVTLAILSAWSLVHYLLTQEGLECSIVIQRNDMTYQKPMEGDFNASARLTRPDDWPRFVKTLSRRGRARINVTSSLDNGEVSVCVFHGDFVATLSPANNGP